MNVVLVISDTFRQDHLGCYGNSWIQTPHLDQFAEQAVVFDRSYAASFPTVPNRGDLLTGRYSLTELGWAPLPKGSTTLPELLAQAGYLTMGIVDTPFYLRNGYGYDQGFADFIWVRGQRAGVSRQDVTQGWHREADRFAAATMSTAERWLERHHDERFFLLVDTWDPHEPWDAPPYYVALYEEEYDGREPPWPCYWDWEEAGLSQESVELAHSHYCAEITMVDRWFGRLLERMASLGLLDSTIVIFTSDHGFYFGEHKLFGKGRLKSDRGYLIGPSTEKDYGVYRFREPETGRVRKGDGYWYRSPLYEEVSRVPLIIRLPDSRPKRIEEMVSSPDLMPTVLELLGLGVPDSVQGTSLAPLIHGEGDAIHDVIVTSWPLYNVGERIRVVDDWERSVAEALPSSITDGEWTLMYAVEGEPVELYNTRVDPEQRENVFAENGAEAQRLHREFVRFLEEAGTEEVFLTPRRRLS